MAFPSSPSSLVLFLILTSFRGVYPGTNITLINNCEFAIWPVISERFDSLPSNASALGSGESFSFKAPASWTGHVWGRTNCSRSEGNFTCATGGCRENMLYCKQDRTRTPVTLVDFSLNQSQSFDSYDVSLVDGYNVPVAVVPQGGPWNNCSKAGCVADLNKNCPSELRVNSSDGEVIACQSACQAFRTEDYCCSGGGSSSCKPNEYSRVFKDACPHAYSYHNDDRTSRFTCKGADYRIMFCLPNDTSRLPAQRFPPTSQGILPSPSPPSPNASAPSSPAPSQGIPPSPSPPSPNASDPSSPTPSQGIPPSPTPRGGTPPFPMSSQVTQSSTKGMKKHIRIGLIVGSIAGLLILGFALFIKQKIKQGEKQKKLHELLTLDGDTGSCWLKDKGVENHDVTLFTYESILFATNNFSLDNKLGEGGFGSVYKGRIPNGEDIAVKLLSRHSGQGLLEFKNEIRLISKLQHVNLVKLLGLCIHGEDKMIIYSYVPNKSLDFFLVCPSKRKQLNWQQRFNIIEGIAQGLLYLHKYSRRKIIHRDLKPSNILLDENMNAKISDFGLARVFEQNMDEASTNRRVGTYGYMAPEYGMQGIFSIKSDIYSFGVIVLEIVSGRKNNSFHQIQGPLNLVEYAWELWRNDSVLQLMDSMLRDSCMDKQLERCIHIGLLWVENRAVHRPTIEDVVLMLKSEMMSLPTPKNPSFIAQNRVLEKMHTSTEEKSSINEITLSETRGR